MAKQGSQKAKKSSAKKAAASADGGKAAPAATRRRRSEDEGAAVRGLVDLGLTLGEARSYVTLLEGEVMTAAAVAADAGIARPKVYEALRLLEEKGFAASVVDGPVARYRALSPSTALKGWVDHRDEDRRARAEQETELGDELIGLLPEVGPSAEGGELFAFIEGVYGRGRTSQALKSMVDESEHEVLNMTQPPWSQPRRSWNQAEIAALGRGVGVRLLITPEGVPDESRWEPLVEAGGEVRATDKIPMKLIICDERVALTSLRDPTTGEQGVNNVLIRHPDIVRSLRLLFDDEWSRAERITQR
jgi:sugar-specific transcriptional regulator TrmB